MDPRRQSHQGCEKIAPQQFHSAAQQRSTYQAVGALLQTPQFAAYVRYMEQRASLHYYSIIAPFTLFIIFYADLIFLVISNDGRRNQEEDDGASMRWYTLIGSTVRALIPGHAFGAYVLCLVMKYMITPMCLLAPFCGMFRDVDIEEGRTLLMVSAMILVTLDCVLLDTAVQPTAYLPLQCLELVGRLGGLLMAYGICRRRAVPWQRMVSFPTGAALWLPVCIGAFDTLWRESFSRVSFVVGGGEIASSSTSYGEKLVVLVSTMLTAFSEVLIDAVGSIYDLTVNAVIASGLKQGGLSKPQPSFASPDGMLLDWSRCFWISTSCLVLALCSPQLQSIAEWCHDHLQPKHPTTILLTGTAIVAIIVGTSALGIPLNLPWFTALCFVAIWIWSSDWSSSTEADMED